MSKCKIDDQLVNQPTFAALGARKSTIEKIN